MANWLSSKLRVAESLLQQIDQQAAESLGKNEKSQPETVNAELPRKAETVPLRDQFKKKNLEKKPDELPKTLDLQKNGRKRRPEGIAKSRKPSPIPSNQVVNDGDWTELLGSPESIAVSGKSNSAVDNYATNETKRNQICGLNQPSSFVSSGPKHTQIDSALLEAKKVHKQTSFGSKSAKDLEVLTEKKVGLDALASDFGKQDHGLFTSIDEVFMKMDVESRNVPDGLNPSQRRFESYKQVAVDSLAMMEKDDIATGDKSPVHRRKYSTDVSEAAESNTNFENYNVEKPDGKVSDDKLISSEDGVFHDLGETSSGVRSDDLSLPNQITSEKNIITALREKENAHTSQVKETGVLDSKLSDTKIQANDHDNRTTVGRSASVLNVGVPGLQNLQGGAERLPDLPADKMDPNLAYSESEERSSSESELGSTSDSDNEGIRREERKRREQLVAEAAALEAIREHDNIVALLEGEKQHLEKILEEQEKEQVQEASKLQSNMEEVMEAVELEKRKHNSTRMEAMARLAKLETTNAELARSLASTQWKLEKEVSRVTQLRQEVELKEVAQAEFKRRISALHQNISSLNQMEGFRGVEFEQEIREAEYNATCEKFNWLKDKAKMLDENVETMRVMLEVPSELEIELKRRLAELTDHLIHKQAQVEALTSEKATLLFRLETLCRSVEDQGLMVQSGDFSNNSGTIWLDPVETNDIEIGFWGQSNPKARLAFHYEIDSVRHHIISMIRQLDAIFVSGAVFWRRNWTAQACGLFYLLSLHIWVLYILFTRDSVDTGLGAVVSLESINKTSGT